jgi:N-acetylmuramoyl-L-alanine amidase
MSEISPLFRSLVAKYAATNILHPQLKAITIAQWMLESARGTSRLATEHFNFAGMKWRPPEMAAIATPISHTTTHDGTAQYCRFASLENFIKGFWIFMGRSPYDGWEGHTATGEDFIKFIGPIWAPAAASPNNPGYASKVIALLPEATALLAAAGGEMPDEQATDITEEPSFTEEKKFVVVLDPGRGGTAEVGGSSANNATAHPSGIKEKAMTLDLAELVKAALLRAAGADPDVDVDVFLTRTGDNNLGLSARANVARAKKASIFLSIHFNAYDNRANGVETLIMPAPRNVNLSEDRALATRINDAVVAALRRHRPATKTRGVKEQGLGVLNDVELGNSTTSHRCRACLLEGEFIDVPEVDALLNTGATAKTVRDDMAKAIAAAIIVDLKAQG